MMYLNNCIEIQSTRGRKLIIDFMFFKLPQQVLFFEMAE